MKIKEIKCRVLKVPRSSYRWRDGFPRAPAERDSFLLQVTAENGVEGYCIGARLGEVIGRQTERLLKPQMVGKTRWTARRSGSDYGIWGGWGPKLSPPFRPLM